MSDITTGELQRDLRALEGRVERERAELLARVDSGFERVEAAIAGLTFVNPDVYLSDQRRQDVVVETLEKRVESVMEERRQDRRLMVGSLLMPIVLLVAGAGIAMLAG